MGIKPSWITARNRLFHWSRDSDMRGHTFQFFAALTTVTEVGLDGII